MVMRNPETHGLRVGVGGLGAIGSAVARRLDEGLPGLRLAAAAARDRAGAEQRVAALKHPPPVVELAELAPISDVVVECAPAAVFAQVAEPAIRAGRIFVTISAGALLERQDLIDLGKESGARIIVPTGALLALDAVRAAAEGEIHSVKMVTRKPPGGFAGAPYVADHGISLDDITEPTKIFDGTARDGARGFPANVNVAAALSLAGIGADRTTLEIWADPTIDRNIQHFEVDADSASFSATIRNIPSEANPRTGRITALSVIAALRSLTAPFRVGT